MHKNFDGFLQLLYTKSPLQKKKLQKYLATRDERFFDRAEHFIVDYIGYLEGQGLAKEDAIDAYLHMCDCMMRARASFLRSGVYPASSSQEAYDQVYSNEKAMKSYMIGLAVSQFLWGSHYEIYVLFEEYLARVAKGVTSYLEIGPGHGLFLSKAIDLLNKNAEIVAVDISPASIKTTESIIKHAHGATSTQFHTVNILEMPLSQKFDFITMGEVLEHVTEPEALLAKVRDLLAPGGNAFVTTCVNCPAVDHVFHFKVIAEIRDMVKDCGFEIIDERVLPVEDLPMEVIVANRITTNYCAILKRRPS